MMTPLTDHQLQVLRAEAGAAGDRAQVALCDRALHGSQRARRACARVLAAAQAADTDPRDARDRDRHGA